MPVEQRLPVGVGGPGPGYAGQRRRVGAARSTRPSQMRAPPHAPEPRMAPDTCQVSAARVRCVVTGGDGARREGGTSGARRSAAWPDPGARQYPELSSRTPIPRAHPGPGSASVRWSFDQLEPCNQTHGGGSGPHGRGPGGRQWRGSRLIGSRGTPPGLGSQQGPPQPACSLRGGAHRPTRQ